MNTADLPSGKKFKSRFIQPGLAGYPQQYGNVLITKESLDKFVNTLEGKPVIINHQEVTANNVNEIEVGRVYNVWFNDEDGWYWCDGVLTSQNAIDLINDGYSVSCSYNVSDFTDKGGTVNNIKYDMEFLDGNFTHLAIVKNPRYEGADIVVVNSMNINNEEGKWITVKGVHIFIPDGKEVDEVIKEKFGDKEKSKKEEKDTTKGGDITKEEHAEITKRVKDLSDEELVKAHFEAQEQMDKETSAKAGSLSKSEATYGIIAQELKKRTGRGFSQSSSEEEIREALKENKSNDGITETTDKYGRTKYSKGNKWSDVSKNGNYYMAAYGLTHKSGVSWEAEKGITEEQLLHSKGFKTEKGAKKWALEQLKRLTSDNSLTNTIAEAMAEVIAENCIK